MLMVQVDYVMKQITEYNAYGFEIIEIICANRSPNELRIRGYKVDVGLVEHYSTGKDGKRQKRQLEV